MRHLMIFSFAREGRLEAEWWLIFKQWLRLFRKSTSILHARQKQNAYPKPKAGDISSSHNVCRLRV